MSVANRHSNRRVSSRYELTSKSIFPPPPPKEQIFLALSRKKFYNLSCTLSIPLELLQNLCRLARELSFLEDAKRALIMPSKYSL